MVTEADAYAAELMAEAEGGAVRDEDAATEDRGDWRKASLWDTRSATKEKTTATSGGSMRGPDDLADEEDDEKTKATAVATTMMAPTCCSCNLPPPRARDGTPKARYSSVNWERPPFEKPDQD